MIRKTGLFLMSAFILGLGTSGVAQTAGRTLKKITAFDLPGSPDIAINYRVLAPSIGGRLGDCDEPPALGG